MTLIEHAALYTSDSSLFLFLFFVYQPQRCFICLKSIKRISYILFIYLFLLNDLNLVISMEKCTML